MRIYPVFTRNQLTVIKELGPNYISSVEFNLALSKLSRDTYNLDCLSFTSMVIDLDSFNELNESYEMIQRKFSIELSSKFIYKGFSHKTKKISIAYLSKPYTLFSFSRHEYQICSGKEVYYQEV